MSKMPATPPRAARRRRKSSGGEEGGLLLLFMIMLGAIAVVRWQVAAVVSIGLLPTLVRLFVDNHPLKSARLQCVALLNLAAVMPYSKRVFDRPNDMMIVLQDISTHVVTWGAAAFGYVFLFVGPLIAAIILQAFSQDKLKALNSQRQELIELWGAEVLGDRPDPNAPKQNFIKPKRG